MYVYICIYTCIGTYTYGPIFMCSLLLFPNHIVLAIIFNPNNNSYHLGMMRQTRLGKIIKHGQSYIGTSRCGMPNVSFHNAGNQVWLRVGNIKIGNMKESS